MSRFVSGGTNDEPSERDEEWLKAQQEIEARHKEKLDAGKQEDGKSLYETLQANKAAKQDAFEESIRLKNQFRSLDEDEVDFLDSVLESSRAKEAEVKKETTEQLDAFRKQQEAAEKANKQVDNTESLPETEVWAAGPRKRKKQKENLAGLKIRRISSTDKGGSPDAATEVKSTADKITRDSSTSTVAPTEDQKQEVSQIPGLTTLKSSSPASASLGLANYSSDEDE